MLFVCSEGVQGNGNAPQFPFVEQSFDRPVSTEGRKYQCVKTQFVTAGKLQESVTQLNYSTSQNKGGNSFLVNSKLVVLG